MPVDHRTRAGEDAELEEAPVDVDRLDRPHPLLAAAAAVGERCPRPCRAGIGCSRARIRGRPCGTSGSGPFGGFWATSSSTIFSLLHPLEVEVGLEVRVDRPVAREVPRLVGPEELRPLRVDRDVLVRDRADVVARERVREPGGEALDVVRRDVRHAVLRALDLRLERLRLGRGRDRQRGHSRCDQQASHHRSPSLT